MIKLKFDPIQLALESARNCYPDLDCTVEFAFLSRRFLWKRFGPWGRTHWPEDGSKPEVIVCPNLPILHLVEILCHELAHVAAGPDAGHGERWKSAFDKIHVEYHRLFAEIAA